MASEGEKDTAYKRGLEGKSGAKTGFSFTYPDDDEKDAHKKGREDRRRKMGQS